MGNLAFAEELADSDELYKLAASESAPEEEDDYEDGEEEHGSVEPENAPQE